MKFILLLFCCSFLALSQLEAALASPIAEIPLVNEKEITLDRVAMEARLGRKLKFSERITLGMLKRKVRKQKRQAQSNGRTDGLAVTSFIVGIGSIFLLAAGGLGFFTAIAGLVLGIISLGRITRNPDFRSGKGLAIAGVAINGGLIFLTLLAVALFIGTFG